MPKIYKKNCDYCNEPYIGQGKKFCSYKCANKAKIKPLSNRCQYCGKLYGGVGHRGSKYCSFECSSKIKKGERVSPKTEFRKGQFSGEKHWNWKGGISTYHLGKSGYIQKRVGDHRYFVHRLVMEEFLGRKLNRNEHVHHINRNRSDNRIENLTILNSHKHSSYHATEQWQNHNFGKKS